MRKAHSLHVIILGPIGTGVVSDSTWASWCLLVVVCGIVTYLVHESGDTAVYVFVPQIVSGYTSVKYWGGILRGFRCYLGAPV